MLGYLSAAADAAGLGDVLKDQTNEQTEEQRCRRILQQQMKEAVNPLTWPWPVVDAEGGADVLMKRRYLALAVWCLWAGVANA